MKESGKYQVKSYCPFCQSGNTRIIVSQGDFIWEQEKEKEEKQAQYYSPFPETTYIQLYPAAIIQCLDCGLGFRSKTPTVEISGELYSEEEMSQDYIEVWEHCWKPIFDRLLISVEKRVVNKGTLLDIGSQFGLFAYLASQKGWDAWGLDPNKHSINRAKQRGVKFYEGVFANIDLPNNYFDAVTAWLVYENLPNFFEETKKVRSILKDNGLFAIKICNFDFYKNLRSLMLASKIGRTIFSRLHVMGYPYQYGFTTRTIRNILDRAGFSNIEVHNYYLTTSLNPQLKSKVVRLERVSKSIINGISGGIGALTGERVIVGPWLEVYAKKIINRNGAEIFSAPLFSLQKYDPIFLPIYFVPPAPLKRRGSFVCGFSGN